MLFLDFFFCFRGSLDCSESVDRIEENGSVVVVDCEEESGSVVVVDCEEVSGSVGSSGSGVVCVEVVGWSRGAVGSVVRSVLGSVVWSVSTSVVSDFRDFEGIFAQASTMASLREPL